MNKRKLKKINRGLSSMGVEPLTESEYAKMIGAANACHDRPNQWNTYDRPWPVHHLAIGSIYMYISEHPHGIQAIFSLPYLDDENATVEITGCKSVDEAKRSLNDCIYKAATVDSRYAAALGELVKAKIAALGSAAPAQMLKPISEILKPISGYTERIAFYSEMSHLASTKAF